MRATGAGFAGLPRMVGRDPEEQNRVASSLELFFDLAFVIAIGVAATHLVGYYQQDHALRGLIAYVLVFLAVWWAWIGFTWFASAFDTDDWLYRVLTMVQIFGVLVLSAGIAPAMDRLDLSVAVGGYVIIRLAQVGQYVRAAIAPRYRATELRYAVGVSVVQLLWVLALLMPAAGRVAVVLLLGVAEAFVPIVAAVRAPMPFHRRHIAERYGAFTLIVLGAGLLSVTVALVDAFSASGRLDLLPVAAVSLVLVGGMWWVYFVREQGERLTAVRPVLVFAYAHVVVFAAAGALAAGLQYAIRREPTEGLLQSPREQAFTTVPVAVFLLAVWFLALRPAVARRTAARTLVLILLIGPVALLPAGLLVAAVLLIAVIVLLERDGRPA